MAAKKQPAVAPAAPLATLSLKLSKSTKGTHVYDMLNEAGVTLGGIYLPKHLLPADPPKALGMILTPKEEG